MSFDWLNVPGLNTATDDRQNSTLPTVSFDFGVTDDSSKEQGMHFLDETMKSSSDPSLVRKLDEANSKLDVPPVSGAYLQQNGLHRSQEALATEEDHKTQKSNINGNRYHNPIHEEEDSYVETPDDLRVPLSLSQNQLTHEELRTYIRWYNYITARTHGKLIKLADVFQFLANFNVREELKKRIFKIFRSCKNALNIGQFFAVLRLLARAMLEDMLPSRKMILEKAPIPRPRPILNKEGGNEFYEEVEEDVPASSGTATSNNQPPGEKVDFDSFASLLLTGKTNSALVSSVPTEQQETEEEREILSDMKDSLSHFKQIQGPDSVTQIPPLVAQGQQSTIFNTGYKVTGDQPPAQTTSQPQEPVLEPLKPTATGSANHLMKSHMSPNSIPGAFDSQPVQVPAIQATSSDVLEPLKPTATGSANYLMKQQFKPVDNQQTSGNIGHVASPQPVGVTFQSTGNQLNQPTHLDLRNRSPLQNLPHQSQQQHLVPQAVNSQPQQQQLHQQGILQPQVHQSTQQHINNSLQQHLPNNNPTNLSAPNANLNSPPLESPGMLYASNAASNYFQSLLSNSPSPNASQANIHTTINSNMSSGIQPNRQPNVQSNANGHLSPNVSYGNNMQMSTQGLQNQGSNMQQMQSQQLPVYSNPTGTTNYQYPGPGSLQRQNSQPVNSQAHRPSFSSMLPPQQQYFQSDTQNTNYQNQGHANQHIPINNNNQSYHNMQNIPTGQMSTQDILGDLQSLKNQVDALQNQYGRL
ncbi:Protein SCD5 [Nakaseomyces glabratus]|uniref:Protein SCD5 n=1 Tax=Candida glabrata TaxID=5478 RepID=A0A0W0DJN5_CANGB|nr:Protein SCD5 [Nakaseomyces glabratus]